MIVKVRCPNPNCNHIFDSKETFSWRLDYDGFPTIEHLYCPKCLAGSGMMHENYSPENDPEYDYEDFVEVIDNEHNS